MVLLALLVSLAIVAIAVAFVVVRAIGLWRQIKRTGGSFVDELSRFEERAARTERLLAEADRSNQELDAALQRLRVSRARLRVLLDEVDAAKQRTRWITAYRFL